MSNAGLELYWRLSASEQWNLIPEEYRCEHTSGSGEAVNKGDVYPHSHSRESENPEGNAAFFHSFGWLKVVQIIEFSVCHSLELYCLDE